MTRFTPILAETAVSTMFEKIVSRTQVDIINRLRTRIPLNAHSHSLPLLAAGIGVDQASFRIVDIQADVPAFSSASHLFLAVCNRSQSFRTVIVLPRGPASKLLQMTLGRRNPKPESLNSGHEGVLLFLTDQAAGDWMRHTDAHFEIRGLLADADQVTDWLAIEAAWCVTAEVALQSLSFCVWCIGHELPGPLDSRIAATDLDCSRALNWALSFRIVIGHTVLSASDVDRLQPGDIVTLDSLCHPALSNATDPLWLISGSILRPACFTADGAIRILKTENHRKGNHFIMDNTEITRKLLPAENAAIGMEVPLQIEVGRIRMSVGEALQMLPGQILRLDRPVSAEVIIRAGDAMVARGELVTLDTELAVRVTDVL